MTQPTSRGLSRTCALRAAVVLGKYHSSEREYLAAQNPRVDAEGQLIFGFQVVLYE
jgi:hypothetical protein